MVQFEEEGWRGCGGEGGVGKEDSIVDDKDIRV